MEQQQDASADLEQTDEKISDKTEGFFVSKRVTISKRNLKKIKIMIEALEIDKKEGEAISEVVNHAINHYYKQKILPILTEESENEKNNY